MEVLQKNVTKHATAFEQFIEQFSPTRDGDVVQVKVPVSRGPELDRLMRDLSIAASALPLSYEGLFLVLVSRWDAFIGNVLRWVYEKQPEILNSSNRSISYVDLKEIGSLDAARKKLVNEEIESVLRESHVEQFCYLERKLKIPLREGLDVWPEFVELTQRRNLIAHAAGRVSQQYLKVCTEHRVKLEGKTTLGGELSISAKYFSNCCDCLTELGFKLSQVLWRKLRPSESEEADAGQHPPAIKILSFALKPPMKIRDARGKLVCVINLAQAHKWSGDSRKCKEVIDKEDWSAASLDFLLALAVLKDDFATAGKLMKQIGGKGDVKREHYDSWPVFKEFRKTDTFSEAFQAVFGTDVETRSVPAASSMLPHSIDLQPDLLPKAEEAPTNDKETSSERQ